MANYNDYLEYLKHVDNTTKQEVTARIDSLNDEIAGLKTSLNNLNKVKDNITDDLSKARTQINEKIDQINQKEVELKRIFNELSAVQNQLNETQKKLSDTEKNLGAEQNKNNNLGKEIAELRKKYAALENEIKDKNKNITDRIDEIQNLQIESERAKADILQLSATKQALEEQAVKYRKEAGQLNDKIQNIQVKLEQTKAEVKVRDEQIVTLRTETAQLKQTINQYSSQTAPDNSKYLAEIQKIQLELERAKVEISRLVFDKGELENKIIEYKKEIYLLKEDTGNGNEIEAVKGLNRQIAELQSQKGKLENDITKNKSALTAAKDEIRLLNTQNKDLQDALAKQPKPKNHKTVFISIILALFVTVIVLAWSLLKSGLSIEDIKDGEYIYKQKIQELEQENNRLQNVIEDKPQY
jgi:chromosome segregation ATPase